MVPHREPPPGLSPRRDRANTAPQPRPGGRGLRLSARGTWEGALPLSSPHVGAKTSVQSPGEGEPEGEVVGRYLPLPPSPLPFFFFSFFFPLIYFQSFWGQCWLLPPRLETKSPPGVRGARYLLRALCPCRSSAGARPCPPVPVSRSLAVSGHLTGAGRSRSVPPGDGERRSKARSPHRPLTSSLAPALRPTATNGTDPPAVPAPRKRVHNTALGSQRERLSAFTCL